MGNLTYIYIYMILHILYTYLFMIIYVCIYIYISICVATFICWHQFVMHMCIYMYIYAKYMDYQPLTNCNAASSTHCSFWGIWAGRWNSEVPPNLSRSFLRPLVWGAFFGDWDGFSQRDLVIEASRNGVWAQKSMVNLLQNLGYTGYTSG